MELGLYISEPSRGPANENHTGVLTSRYDNREGDSESPGSKVLGSEFLVDTGNLGERGSQGAWAWMKGGCGRYITVWRHHDSKV